MLATEESRVTIHPSARCESSQVGAGTRVWAFAHVMEGATVGRDCNICDHSFVESGARIGDGVIVKNGAMIWDGVTLEDHVFVGPGVIFTNDRHPRSRHVPESHVHHHPDKAWLVPTTVRHGASIGASAVVICGVTIGAFSVVGAGAIVTRDVPGYRLVLGQPARPVGWACRCGVTLNAQLVCPKCSRRYVSSGETLVLQE